MALPYSCCRLLLFHQPVRSLRHSLYLPLKQNVRHSALSRSIKLQYELQTSRLPLFQRLCRRGFKTKRSVEEIETSSGHSTQSTSLFRHYLYTAGFCSVSFAGAMIWNYEKMRKVFHELQNEKIKEKKQKKAFGFRDQANSIWSKLSSGQKMVLAIMSANLGVFLLWRVVSLQPMMIRYFTSSINHPLLSMTLSSFSHISFLHLFVNMYVLWSFASVSVNLFGAEQFAAFYLSAGTVSSLVSMTCSKLLKRPLIVSVGASGAIMAMLGAVCVTFPTAQLGIAFISDIIPHSFSADTGMKAIIAIDVLGLVLGWRVLDHAGHLGGILFGILYAKYGNKLVWSNRETIMKWWHDLRGKP